MKASRWGQAVKVAVTLSFTVAVAIVILAIAFTFVSRDLKGARLTWESSPLRPFAPSDDLKALGGDLEEEDLAAWDVKQFGLKANQGQTLVLEREAKVTEWSVVYLHGFSASPLELEPTIQEFAKRMRANLFVARFKAHGLQSGEAFRSVKAEEWIADAIHALQVGARIGKKVIVVGLSTGASLGILATERAVRDGTLGMEWRPAAQIWLSPNFEVRSGGSALLMPETLAPFAVDLVQMVLGTHREFAAINDLQRERWTTRYRSEGVVEMFRVLRALRDFEISKAAISKVPTLVVYSRHDDVVSVAAILNRSQEVAGPFLKLVETKVATRHEMVSRAFSPERVSEFVEQMVKGVESVCSANQ